jgi:formamidopyrimidine-DNA glycosylase
MPELPEVEVVRRGLERFVVGREVAAVAVLHPRAVRRQPAGAADFIARLAGGRIESAHRRDKYSTCRWIRARRCSPTSE